MLTKFLFGFVLFGLLTSTVFAVLVLLGARNYLRDRKRNLQQKKSFTPPVTLLKPLHGSEPHLEEHLESFFLQAYPQYEILFCARYPEDAGLCLAQKVAARHPEIPVKFLTTGDPKYINAKVGSLELMGKHAQHDLWIISDSDVRVAPNYILEVVAPFADKKVGLITCAYRGVAADGGFWALLEAVGMSVEMTAGVLVARMLEGMKFALGPTMAMRRECVDAIGGFSLLGDYCADDFVLGNQIAEKGYTVLLSDHVIDHMILNSSFVASMKHQTRWMKSTRFSRPKGHFGTSLTFSLPFGLLGLALGAITGQWALALACFAWSLITRIAIAGVVAGVVLGERPLWRLAFLYPIRDFMGFCFWAASYGSNKILWRGEIYELVMGGVMKSTLAAKAEKKEAAVLIR